MVLSHQRAGLAPPGCAWSYLMVLAFSIVSLWAGGAVRAQTIAPTNTGPPTLEGFVPESGSPGIWVGLNGSNLHNLLSVRFNGLEAEFTTWVGSVFPPTAKVPTNATTGPITVTTPEGSYTTTKVFTVITRAAPRLDDFSPTSGPPGTVVDLLGTNLTAIQRVEFNGSVAFFSDIGAVGAPHPITIVPEGATSGPITVTTDLGTAVSADWFNVTAPPVIGPPDVFGFSPMSGPPGTYVTFTGTNLVDVTAIHFGGVAGTVFTLPVGHSVAALVPIDAASGPVQLVTRTGACFTREPFTVTSLPGPIISAFEPDAAAYGTHFMLHGANFEFLKSVRFGEAEAEFVPFSNNEIWVRVPYVSSGPVTVITAGGSATSVQSFNVIGGPPPPRITGFSPRRGASGSTVEVFGEDFGNITQVLFDGTPARFNAYTDRVSAVVPAGAQSGPIRLVQTTGEVTTEESFATFNTPGLTVGVSVSTNLVFWGHELVLQVAVTNSADTTLYSATLTNTFASTSQPPVEVLTQEQGGPIFQEGLGARELEIVNVDSAGRKHDVMNGTAVRFELGDLPAKTGLMLSVRLKPRTGGILYGLASASGSVSAMSRSYGSWLSTVRVIGPSELVARRSDERYLEIAWPVVEPPLQLQVASEPVRSASWSLVNSPVNIIDGRYQTTIAIGDGAAFYRLTDPTLNAGLSR